MSQQLAFQRRLQAAREQRHAAAAASPARPIGRAPALLSPERAQLVGNMIRGVRAIEEANKETNTQKAIDAKKEEWMQHCDKEHHKDDLRCLVTADKAHPFMCYQMFREQKPRGGNRAQLKANIFFDHAKYKEATGKFKYDGGIIVDFPNPANPVGMSAFTQYRAALKELFHDQQAQHREINTSWEHVWLPHFKKLQEHVKHRKQRIKKANYEEKQDAEFAPCSIVEHFPDIEQKLWDTYETGKRSACCSLRHRFCATFLTAGILRAESLYNAELSDFQGIFVTGNDNDIHPIYVMIMQIPFGKTNKGMVRCGRAIRHKNVLLCCIGAIAFYLQYRFFITKEFADFTVNDWLNNKKWFDVKLLVDVYGDLEAKMQNDSYGDRLKDILQLLGLSCSKILHLGRNVGAKILDLLEELKDEKRNMGQWSPDVVDKSCSSKLPMRPMRKLAGFTQSTPMYYNKRTVIAPPDDLLLATPMGKWVYDAFVDVGEVAAMKPGKEGVTAVNFLKFLCHMNQVFLQDAAAMLALHPKRGDHPVFKDIPVLRSKEFMTFKDKVKLTLVNDKNPLNARLEQVIPGLHQWHKINEQTLAELVESVNGLRDDLKEVIRNMVDQAKEDRENSSERLAALLKVLAEFISPSSNGNSNSNKLGASGFQLDIAALDRLREAAGGGQDSNQSTATSPTLPTTTTEGDATTTAGADGDDAPRESIYQLQERNTESIQMEDKHRSLFPLWNEWHGLEEYQDNYGGIKGREKKFKSRWRKGVASPHHFSRTRRVVEGIEAYAKEKKCAINDALEQLDPSCELCKHSVANFVNWLQAHGYLKTRAPRFKKNKDGDNTTTTTTTAQ